ncbi:MAG: type I methionyl aminopeptidase [Syntrophotalea acetylenica]|uniref:Methionine aminopeptidase n=1 Tax=Syntrophotalea acetylenica TaxID=29542 RepID=A0A1L3GEC6_SYNAC|nr:type I methionyl aminopeptidase [Syntrophotalea acetylenica]APG24175.1 type I methionyl aminopeptidase [Syntrophotalea acetylenica]APG44756.1 type I methionyl aminopeptidase [Syntrophotalea acetylenica]MDD4456218.1 type I methionyl aminopeptidase [Syntrophotalea acetylenica]MDY0261867.1 type I methionyl aminopeptidase [Syntrophotalea acetylenica]
MIPIKSSDDLLRMRESGRMVAEILALLAEKVVPGITTLELDRLAERECKKRGAKPAFKGYGGFPFSICASPEDRVVHGFPDRRPLLEGEILSIDFGVVWKGFYGDSAMTLPVGKIDAAKQRLLDVTGQSLALGIAQAIPGNRLFDISHAIQSYVEAQGFSVVKEFVGHGIGRGLHEDPQVPNFGPPGQGPLLRCGMVLAIEPMINAGKCGVKVLEDGWTAVTSDGKPSAHFEHTVAITDEGPQILTAV